jgi:DNA polymerase-3 subunit alpha
MMASSLVKETAIELLPIPDPPRKEMLSWEKDLMGLYLSEHPLQQVLDTLQDAVTFSGEINEAMNGQRIAMAGIVSWLREITTKKGDPMAFVGLEDLQGTIELVVFPRTYAKFRELLREESLLLVQGKVDVRGREPKVLCDRVQDHLMVHRPVENRASPHPQHLFITFQRTANQEQDKQRLRQVYSLLEGYQGEDQFSFIIPGPNGRVQLDFPNVSTRYCPDLVHNLDRLIGSHAVRVTSIN